MNTNKDDDRRRFQLQQLRDEEIRRRTLRFSAAEHRRFLQRPGSNDATTEDAKADPLDGS